MSATEHKAAERAARAGSSRGVRRRALIEAGGIGLLSGAALAACGPFGAGGSGQAGAPVDATPGAPSTIPVSIEVLTRAGVENPTGHSQFYNHRAKQVFTPQTNITVNLVDASPNVGENLTVLAAGGTLPDAAWFGVVADGAAGREQATRGIFRPLDDLARNDRAFDRAPYFPAMLDAFSVGGRLYALPTHAHYGTNVLYYNRNMTRAAGVTIPDDGNWTTDEFIAAAQMLTRRGEEVWGWWPSWGFSEFGTFWVRQFGGEFLDVDGRQLLLASPEARAGLDWVNGAQTRFQTVDSLYREGGNTAAFEQGRLAAFTATPGLVAEYRKPGQERVTFDLGIALFPRHPSGRRGTQASGSGMGITSDAKAPAAWEYVKFVTNKENGVEQVFGGAGSPGARTDVWNDARLLAFDPIYSRTLEAYPQGAGSLRTAANFRYSELVTAINAELTPFFQGQAGLVEATTRAVQAGNAILAT